MTSHPKRFSNARFAETAHLFGANAAYLEALYAQYLADPSAAEPGWADYFAGYTNALIYYVKSTGTPIANGATMGGFRFLSVGAASPYALFDTDGNVVAQGETNDGQLPVEAATWGGIKALFR